MTLSLTDHADIISVLAHAHKAQQLLTKLNYQEFGQAETHLHDALQEIQAWKAHPLTKRPENPRDRTQ